MGFKLSGKLREGITATDPVLTVTQMLRQHGVVGKFVEFYGDGRSLPCRQGDHRQYGAGVWRHLWLFPIDDVQRSAICVSAAVAKNRSRWWKPTLKPGMWRQPGDEPVFTSTPGAGYEQLEASLAGPKRPQDRVALGDVPKAFAASGELEVNHLQRQRQPVDYTLNGHLFATGWRGGYCSDYLLHQYL